MIINLVCLFIVYVIGMMLTRTVLVCANIWQGYCDDMDRLAAQIFWPLAWAFFIVKLFYTYAIEKPSNYLVNKFCPKKDDSHRHNW